MDDEVLMYCASALYFVCYFPELYANYVNKNANIYNMPEKIIMLTASSLGLTYAIRTNNVALMTNYGPLITFDTIALLMRLYYAYKNKTNKPNKPNKMLIKIAAEDEMNIEERIELVVLD
jgi:uncharacterized protein with PQ loop repeat